MDAYSDPIRRRRSMRGSFASSRTPMATKGSRGHKGSRKTEKLTSIIPETLTRKGFKIRARGPLPDGFDPMKATVRQLAAHRLPRRPDAEKEPQLRALWDRTMSRTK